MYLINFKSLPEVNMLGRVKQMNGWNHLGRKISRELIVFVVNGRAEFNLEGKNFPLETGDVLYIPQNTFYKANTEDFCEYFFFHFDCYENILGIDDEKAKEVTIEAFRQMTGKFHFCVPDTQHDIVLLDNKITLAESFDRALYIISKCQDCSVGITPNKKLMLDLYFSELLLHLSSVLENSFSKAYEFPPFLLKMLKYISQNYTENITLSGLSESYSVSKSYIERLFKKYLKTSVTRYINDLKLYHAADLLLSSTLNISEVSRYIGFSSCYYFSRLFKKAYLVSPANYIKQYYGEK